MDKKSSMMLKALLDRSSRKEALLAYFKPEESSLLRSLPSYPHFQLTSFLTQESSPTEYHYSWFVPVLQSMDPKQQQLFLSLFDKNRAQKLQKLLSSSLTLPALPPFLRPFLRQELKKKIMPKELLPIEFLPESELLILLQLSKEQLLHLIDLLGMYDLAADIRQIVDKALLSQIATALTQEQRQFLQQISKQSMHYLPKRMNLKELQGDRQKLNRLLHKRGLERLATALTHESSDFLWHLLHKLDTGRAALLEQMKQEIKEEGMVAIFKKQVSSLATRIIK